MTIDETIDLLAVVRILWPHSDIGEPREAAPMWSEFLRPYPIADVEAALRRLAAAGREHAPPVGVLVREVENRRQGAAPSGEDAQRWLARHARLLPYSPQGQGEDDTVAALERLAAAGAHEAVLRFVAAHGVYAIRMMPDPERFQLDPGQSANRRDMLRDYQQRIVPEWEADPRSGVAVERACRAAGIDPAGRPQVATLAPDELRARRVRKALNAPSPEPEPEEDGPVISAEDALALFRRTAAANRMAREQAKAATARMRAEEYEELRRTERELDQRRAGQQDS